MSGIAGIYNRDSLPVDRQTLEAMTDAAAYRGPDGIGHWTGSCVGLGQLNLCTTPESVGEQQPLVSDDGNYVITCDGRVDNREELLDSLRPQVAVSVSSSDAWLILQSYLVWGSDCVYHIVGDYAFVIWDGLKRRLLCVRDRLGIRPFHYFNDQNQFVFGSDISSLLQQEAVPYELNEVMVGLYLSGAISDGEQTLYKGIQQLPAGHFLLVDEHGLSKQLYWELEPDKPIILGSEKEYIERFAQLFDEAVRCRLRSTTPVAATLSGGLDSSSIVCVAEELRANGQAPDCQLETYSAVFSEFSSANETKYIQSVLDKYGTPAHFVNSDGYWSFKPFRSSYPLPNHPLPIPHQARHEALLDEIQNRNIKVELTGEGGDEILYVFASSYFWHLYLSHKWSTLRRDLKIVTPAWRRSFYRQVLSNMAPSWVRSLYRKARKQDSDGIKTYPIIDETFSAKIGLQELVGSVLAPKEFRSPHWRDQHAIVRSFSRNFFLSYYSQAALWHGVEARFPFLDSRLIDFICRVPPEMKVVREGLTKRLLRQAMRGVLPEMIRQRPDKGDFSSLFTRGLAEIGETQFNDLVENGYLTRMGFVDKDKLAGLFDARSCEEKYPTMRFITFFSLEQWLHQLFAGGGSTIPNPRALPRDLTKRR